MGAKMAALTGRVSGNIDLTVVFFTTFQRRCLTDRVKNWEKKKNYSVYLNKNSIPINKAGNDKNGLKKKKKKNALQFFSFLFFLYPVC